MTRETRTTEDTEITEKYCLANERAIYHLRLDNWHSRRVGIESILALCPLCSLWWNA